MPDLSHLRSSIAVFRGRRTIARLLVPVVVATLALGWGVCFAAGNGAEAVASAATDPAAARDLGVTEALPAVMAPGAERIAVKLAPGYRLQSGADGALMVTQEHGLAASAEVRVHGVVLKHEGEVHGLGIHVVEAASGGLAAAGEPTAGEGDGLKQALDALRLSTGVVWAEASHPVYACLIPDDPLYQPSLEIPLGQWGPGRVGLPAAWNTATGSADLVVAVIDSGLNRDILEFSGRIFEPYSIISGSSAWPAWQDTYGHGSGVTAVAVAQGNDHLGIAGAAWNVKVMPVKIAEENISDDLTLAAGIIYAVDKGADVINVSFAGAESSITLESAVDYALARGAVVVAAAGNSGAWSVGYPAGIPGVIAVGATDTYDNRPGFSNQGNTLDIAAPGVSILSYGKGGPTSFTIWSGTSFSAPLVAGTAALLRSVDPSLTPVEVADILTASADDLGVSGWDQAFGWGLLDAEGAVAEAASGVTTTTTLPTTSTSTSSTSTTTTTLPPTTTTTAPPSTTTTTTSTTIVGRFADVSAETTPYAAQIEQLAAAGVVDGYVVGDRNEFRPDELVKRQQFAKMIVLTLGYAVSEYDVCTFTDVVRMPGKLYPYHYVAVAYNNGITQGTKPPQFFSPYGNLTRAQMITMVVRATALPEPPLDYDPPFPNFSTVHYPFARKAAGAGLLDVLGGMNAGYDFLVPATRAEVCALLAPLLR